MDELGYSERMKKQTEFELSFEPKSFWEYKIGTPIDKLCDDKLYKETLTESAKVDWVNAGAGGFMSKFVSENAKKVIEFWTKTGDLIVDPFAGRTRGLLATILKRNYIGFEVVEDNIENIKGNYAKLSADYTVGSLTLHHTSSEFIDKHIKGEIADIVYTCPPYWNVERYESTENQLSDIKDYNKFLEIYKTILHKASDVLKPGGFFVIVIANFRRNGKFYDFRTDTSQILKEKLDLHDEVILEMSPAKRHPLYPQAITNLNMLKTHEYCLIFRKQDTSKNLVEWNNQINFNRPKVKDIYKDKEKLFWSKNDGKIDWINDKLLQKGDDSKLMRFFMLKSS